MPVQRQISARVLAAARRFPVVSLTGPRQSGKTTLSRTLFPDLQYVTLEAPDVRSFAEEDPRGFLAGLASGAILDEFQRVPSLASYLQGVVDEDPSPGRFVLTGSENLAVTSAVGQSLAGRAAVLHLLPLTAAELRAFPSAPSGVWQTVFAGGYPAIYDRAIPPSEWLSSYIATYVERDVRQVRAIGDLGAFRRFLRLAAARTGTLMNATALGADAGVDHKTAAAWTSVLEGTWIAHRIPAWHRNIGKRLVKTPRFHFFDTGLVCALLGIQTPEQLAMHPLRGPIFETWVASELYKTWLNRRPGSPPLLHLSQNRRIEVDLLLEESPTTTLIEVKSGATVAGAWFASLDKATELVASAGAGTRSAVVYGGDEVQTRSRGELVPWSRVGELVGGGGDSSGA